MSKKNFKKVVEWKEDKWKNKKLDFKLLTIIFFVGIGVGLSYTESSGKFLVGLAIALVSISFINFKKRKVHWEEIK